MEIMDGKMVASHLKNNVKEYIDKEFIGNKKRVPTLACILVGDNPASQLYVSNKEKACKLCGMDSRIINLKAESTQEEVLSVIKELNRDDSVSGILLQLPLPKHLDEDFLVNQISSAKDVDCLTELNLGKLFSGNGKIAPCTSTGIIDLIDYYGVEIEGKRAVVIGRSLLVGKTVANLLEQRNATVTICHSKTKNMQEITKQADILVVAVGKPKFVSKEMVKEGAVVIDVGINKVDGKTVGDVDFDSVKDVASYITKVPGGVGPMTIAELMKNTLVLHNDRIKAKTKTADKEIER